MLKLLFALLIGAAHAQAVDLSKYLVFTDRATACARSVQQCTQYGCKPGTTYWWALVATKTGAPALQIQSSGVYGSSAAVGPCAVGCGLTSAEINQLQFAAAVGPVVADQCP